jgi:hypothetical protein
VSRVREEDGEAKDESFLDELLMRKTDFHDGFGE